MLVPVITVDGPSGVGKGVLSQWLAEHLGWHLLDSGCLYRLTALAIQQQNPSPLDETQISAIARALDVDFHHDQTRAETRIYLAGQEVTDSIRTEECGSKASQIAAMPEVREALLERQRDFRRPPGLIADGRDMGTIVFPDAQIKIFLTASVEERALRRHGQLQTSGIEVELSQLILSIAERDERDATRQVAPLRPADDATIVDTTGLTIREVREQVLAIIY